MEESTKQAFAFLSARNPFDIPYYVWTSKLHKYLRSQGNEAIEAMAGFYVFVIKSNKYDDDNKNQMIASTFAHDLNGMDDEFMAPKTEDYIDFWKNEMEVLNG